MNLARKSIVERYGKNSVDYSIVQDICSINDKGTMMANETENLSTYVDVLKNVSVCVCVVWCAKLVRN